MPTSVVAILTFFVRYVDVVADQYAHAGRAAGTGMRSTSPRSWPVIARPVWQRCSSGRANAANHLALVSRGYDGKLPAPRRSPYSGRSPRYYPSARRHFRDRCDDAMVIELRGVDFVSRRHRGGDVSLSIARDERVLVRPERCGQEQPWPRISTVCWRIQEGEVRVAGRRVERSTLRDTRRQVRMVFQDPDDQLFMPTVAQDVAFGPTNFRAARRSRSQGAACADAVGMGSGSATLLVTLSFGQRRRNGDHHGFEHGSGDPGSQMTEFNLDPASRRRTRQRSGEPGRHDADGDHDLLFAWRLCRATSCCLPRSDPIRQVRHELLTDAGLLARFRPGVATVRVILP